MSNIQYKNKLVIKIFSCVKRNYCNFCGNSFEYLPTEMNLDYFLTDARRTSILCSGQVNVRLRSSRFVQGQI